MDRSTAFLMSRTWFVSAATLGLVSDAPSISLRRSITTSLYSFIRFVRPVSSMPIFDGRRLNSLFSFEIYSFIISMNWSCMPIWVNLASVSVPFLIIASDCRAKSTRALPALYDLASDSISPSWDSRPARRSSINSSVLEVESDMYAFVSSLYRAIRWFSMSSALNGILSFIVRVMTLDRSL